MQTQVATLGYYILQVSLVVFLGLNLFLPENIQFLVFRHFNMLLRKEDNQGTQRTNTKYEQNNCIRSNLIKLLLSQIVNLFGGIIKVSPLPNCNLFIHAGKPN